MKNTKIKSKKLSLHRNTLRRLDGELAHVRGGYLQINNNSAISGCWTQCADVCQWTKLG